MNLINKAAKRNKNQSRGRFVSPADETSPGKQKQALTRLNASLNKLIQLISKDNYPDEHRLSLFKDELLSLKSDLAKWQQGTITESEIYRLVNLNITSRFSDHFIDWYRRYSRNAVLPRNHERYEKLFDEVTERLREARKRFRP